jgi:hypothetical protein
MMLKIYLTKIAKIAGQNDSREESFYSTLEALVIDCAENLNKKTVQITTNPKKTDAGNPDFKVKDGEQRTIGYIEAKKPDRNLDEVENTKQVKKYIDTFPNFILTNFIEFRLYKNGSIADAVKIANPATITIPKAVQTPENALDFKNLFAKFFSFSLPSITSARQLALELAKRTGFLRDEVIAEEIREEEKRGIGRILGFYEAFQKYLIKGLTKDEFADLYSQTITYGLFASRMRCKKDFSRKLAVYDIPHSVGILREIFDFISLGDLPTQMEWIVDEITEVLANVDVSRIFSEFFVKGKGEDPVFHFYETFLKEYDPSKREQKGVYYTPQAVVSYITRSIHLILKDDFDLEEGLADFDVTILDPAGGTLTFLAEAMRQAVKEFTSKYGKGGKDELVKEHLIEDFYAFELMVAPYAIGHLKISFLLANLGYTLQEDERIKFFLTNTLELEEIEQTSLPGMASLAEESRKAGEVKKKIPILVILGNPPYSGISANMGKWITDLIEDYKYVDGKHFGEKKHWLHDDYVKFIRFAEWKINQVGRGVIGFITNRSYIENPTFRGMRQHLMTTFDEIQILDLHGESSPGMQASSEKDENVFDITKGVAISFFIKKNDKTNLEKQVYYGEIRGKREDKYEWLLSHNIVSTDLTEVYPESPFYFFVPFEEKLAKQYDKYLRISDIYKQHSVGVVTARDDFVIDFDYEDLRERIQLFREHSMTDEALKSEYGLKDTSTFKLHKSREKLSNDRNWEDYFTKILYRPFDIRHIYYTNIVVERPLYQFMKHMMEENLAIISARTNKSSRMTHFFCTNSIMEAKCGERTTQSYLFPLFLYSEKGKKSNLNEKLVKQLEDIYGRKLEPEAVASYIYSIFYSNIYRKKYRDNLRLDFPRVPFTTDYELFTKLGKLGNELLLLHLLRSSSLSVPTSKFQGIGTNVVSKPEYDDTKQRVCINDKQYFTGVDSNIWNYEIGGYQVLSKWLKYRNGRALTTSEIKHLCKVITALRTTIKIQKEIDLIFPYVEKDVVSVKSVMKDSELHGFS